MSARKSAVPQGTIPTGPQESAAAGFTNDPGAPGVGIRDVNQTNSTTTCDVGCKLASGFLMELGKKGDANYKAIKLNGVNKARVIGGFGITEGVPLDFFNRWCEKVKHFRFMKNGLIFQVGTGDTASFMDMAKELKDQKTGTEKLNPKDLPPHLRPPQQVVDGKKVDMVLEQYA